jgi:cobalt-zinc-cadmium efflux system membrane fusion protein
MWRNVLIFISIVGISACTGEKQKVSDATAVAQPEQIRKSDRISFSEDQLVAAGITTGKPLEQNISGQLLLQGFIEPAPQSIVHLSFPLGGYIRATAMTPGAAVRKGQPLATLEDMQYIQLQQDYLTAKEQFALAQLEYQRQQTLNSSKASADKLLEQAKAQMESQRILKNALARKLEIIGIQPALLHADNITKGVSLYAPIDGFISKVNVSTGQYITPNDILFELVDPRHIQLVLQVFEKDLQRLEPGQQVAAYSNDQNNMMWEAEITLIGTTFDANRMAEVRCRLKNPGSYLKPGMYMNGKVATGSHKAITVPEDALVRWENIYYLFVQKAAGTYEMLPVTVGEITDGRVAVQAPALDTATVIITTNAYAALMKMKNKEEE